VNTDGAAGTPVTPPVSILLVDDNAAKRLALKVVLAPLGYSIVEADSGTAALRCVMAQDFAVILLDVCMPVMDGFETAALIRRRRQSEMTPIIFITAFASDEIGKGDRYAEGAVDFIFAPVPPDELRAKISVFANLFIQAEQLAARAREVQTSADQFRRLAGAAPIGIFQTDAANRYVYTNPRWTEITGITAKEATGRQWDSMVGPEQRAGVVVATGDDAVDGPDLCQRFEIRAPGATPRIVLATSKSIPDSAGGIAGWVGTLADVTAEVGAEAAMSDARDAATESSRLKSDFLANMSHEIRTPMNGVIGMTDLLLETDLDARQREYAQTVRNSGEALLAIINDILDFSKVEAGKLEIEDIAFNLQAIVHDVVDLLAGSAQTKGLELVAFIDSAVPAVVNGDPGRVRQVLTNLIGNAIKFTHTGEIVVRVSETAVDGPDTVVHFEVTDTGDGIAPDKLAQIFEPFAQADTSTSRKYGGTGLGLAISGQLVALMGGDCGVSSQLGKGSSFWFTICVSADTRQASSDSPPLDAGLIGITALIVDDNDAQRAVLADYLTEWGMAVTSVDSGAGALATLRGAAMDGRPFAVALTDRSMPGMNGLELNDAIALDPTLTTRVVLMTDLGQEHDHDEAATSGVSASLSKPVHREDLRTSLHIALGLQVADVVPHTATAQRLSQADKPELGQLLLAEDNPINQKVAVAMLTSAGYRVDTVPNGAAAVEAVAAQRYDAILMDCQMPELSGYEATAAIRANEGPDRHTPIIALTAGARREDRERCLAEGMDSYLSKPLSKDVLLALVAQSVKNGPTPTPLLPRVRRASAAEIVVDPNVLDELRAVAGDGEPDFVTNLVDQFVRETGLRLVELRSLLELGDLIAVARLAHTLQGSASQLGGRRLALSCERLERTSMAGSLSDAKTDLRVVDINFREMRRTLAQRMSTVETITPAVSL
jgi:PAS domain S-box-containing protein